jgi:hypothetical protein
VSAACAVIDGAATIAVRAMMLVQSADVFMA